ncbi:dTDP-4-dehydrorhamnose reductase [uncultured Wocania sp.]|uniref:dTDP-4-dehydrorhamnose reductase n=1 Tax=uncultured Wocania sp. TaxID=2834404 RepID=UPI0030F5E303
MIKVLVTGANGQLGHCIKDIQKKYSHISFVFTDYKNLDICDEKAVSHFFQENEPFHYCINCAAYTAVDKAEEEKEKAYNINAFGPKHLALACKMYDTILIHVSTDFVFDGLSSKPYTEKDGTNPISVYGKTKLQGELLITGILKEHFIIRTSWLYSEHGNNFMKTMLRMAETRNEISVVGDQMGTPTYAKDLAKTTLKIIDSGINDYGIYHFSNCGETSWHGFAKAIFQETNIQIKVKEVKTEEYFTLAKRPAFSVLSKKKTIGLLGIKIPHWRNSLKIALRNYKTIIK